MQSNTPSGATPLDPDETEGLLQGHVTTRGELDELEEANIQNGILWAIRTAITDRRRVDVLSEEFLFELHERMFGEVWDWAGEVRRTNKNIGVDKHSVGVEVKKLVEDARHWREQQVYSSDEIAVRFHHRLVAIHPFPNGSGRHARMMADLIALQSGRPTFSWGGGQLTSTSELRNTYMNALRKADAGDLTRLLEFARS